MSNLGPRPWYKKKRFIIPIGLLIIAGVSTTHGGSANTSAGSAPAVAAAAPVPAAAPVAAKPLVISAMKLAKAFDANKVAATHKYASKRVRLSAVITNIDNSSLTFGQVEGELSLTTIVCNLSDPSQVDSLTNGHTATVVGTVSGQDFGVIGLDDCAVI